MDANDFYKSDEPVDKIVQAFERGEKGLTGRPTWSVTTYLAAATPRTTNLFEKLSNKTTKELPAH
jgi:hypothetical protein